MLTCINFKNIILFGLALITLNLIFGCTPVKPKFIEVEKFANVFPEYNECTIPPNIAPLNFVIKEPGLEFFIDIYVEGYENHIVINQSDCKVQIPIDDWKQILENNKGSILQTEIFARDSNGAWKKYNNIKYKIAHENIDSHIAYRLINPGYMLWWEMGLYQRNIENFDESTIFSNNYTEKNCMNCHSFSGNNPDKMLFHMRGKYGGTIIYNEGELTKINTATDYTMSAGVYPAWHPEGKHIAFSVNKIQQRFHSAKDKSIHVSDYASDLIVYDIEKNMVTTSPKISTDEMENVPNWSPDGKYLYFSSSPKIENAADYEKVKYDIKRISYNTNSNEWGDVETIISANEIGKSCSFPKISPNGKFLLFTMSDYGYFGIHFKSSDLCLMNLQTGEIKNLGVNSESSDSYHSWSANSKWIVFASKRLDGLCSRLYFSYIDENGNSSVPVLLPQEDPEFYDSFLKNYNVPELITGPVNLTPYEISKAAYLDAKPVKFDPDVQIDALSGASKIKNK